MKSRSYIHVRNSFLICVALMKAMPPQSEVGLMKIVLFWNRSWTDDCPTPRFSLAQTSAPKRPGSQKVAPELPVAEKCILNLSDSMVELRSHMGSSILLMICQGVILVTHNCSWECCRTMIIRHLLRFLSKFKFYKMFLVLDAIDEKTWPRDMQFFVAKNGTIFLPQSLQNPSSS